jgi:hypothetical protein
MKIIKKPYNCKNMNCQNKVYYKTFYYGSGYCGSCSAKSRVRLSLSTETKLKISKSLLGRKRPDISKNMMGIGNHRYTGKINYCKNCNQQLKNLTANYCWNCYIILGLNTGINASNYIDGTSRNKYAFGFTSKLKYQIRTRDNFECQNCNMTEKKYLSVYGRVLEIHHIDYNKNHHQPENLISLCKQCNVRANYNRNIWKEKFLTMLINKGVING